VTVPCSRLNWLPVMLFYVTQCNILLHCRNKRAINNCNVFPVCRAVFDPEVEIILFKHGYNVTVMIKKTRRPNRPNSDKIVIKIRVLDE